MRSRAVVAFVSLLAVLLVAVALGLRPGPATGAPSSAQRVRLTVMVPCGLAGPYGELKKQFAAKRPDIELHQRVDNTFVMAKEVVNGKDTADVMLCLGNREAEYLANHGKVTGRPVRFAQNAVAILVQKGNPKGIKTVQDLARPEVKQIGVATGEVNSLGFYAEQACQRAKIWDKIKGKCWRPDEPVEIGTAVAQGKLDAGLIYATCMKETRTVGGKPTPRKKSEGAARVDQKLYDLIYCSGVKLAGCKNVKAADDFLAFVARPEHAALWTEWGFDPLGKPAGPRK